MLDSDNKRKVLAILSKALLWVLVSCETKDGFVGILKRDSCSVEAQCLLSGERFEVDTTGGISDVKIVHKNSRTGRNRVQAFTSV